MQASFIFASETYAIMGGEYAMKRIFVSVPFAGRTFEEVNRELQVLKNKYMHENGYTVEDLKYDRIEFVDDWDYYDQKIPLNPGCKNPKLRCIANALLLMSYCDDAIFSENWETARGCQIEHLAYELYMKESS